MLLLQWPTPTRVTFCSMQPALRVPVTMRAWHLQWVVNHSRYVTVLLCSCAAMCYCFMYICVYSWLCVVAIITSTPCQPTSLTLAHPLTQNNNMGISWENPSPSYTLLGHCRVFCGAVVVRQHGGHIGAACRDQRLYPPILLSLTPILGASTAGGIDHGSIGGVGGAAPVYAA